ncbi:hypothetical protein F5Y04DRAFT_197544 [Hypomontagnella monticulosa]|nr:hypothetical protein F5Y04DRAFT_197544 [Hypomontagnella monticulosa]
MASKSVDGHEEPALTGEEWTKVRHKGRRQPKADQHVTPSHHNNILTSQPQSSFLSPSAIASDHRHILEQWGTSTCCYQLRDLIASHTRRPVITQAICFGLGTFDPDDGSWEIKRRAHVQLAAFLYMVDQIQRGNPEAEQKIVCLFQEPLFNAADKEFIRSLGYEVVNSPGGFERVNPSSLVFGIHLYRDVYSRIIAKCCPAMFIGTPWDVWEDCHGLGSLDWPELKGLDAQCDKAEFPQDTGYTTFSSTMIHWRRPGET